MIITGPLHVAHAWRTSPSGTICPRCVADLELLEVLDLLAEVGVGLHVDLPGAAEAVEVVDVAASRGRPAAC